MFNHILLCTHGSEGARCAERFAFQKMEADPDLKVSVLTVLDEDWRSMTGDDWLNSSKTHATFLDHVQDQVSEEIVQEWDRIRNAYPHASGVEFIQRTGKIAEIITGVAGENRCDAIAIGPCRKKKGLFSTPPSKGLRDTLKNKEFHRLLPCPLIVVP